MERWVIIRRIKHAWARYAIELDGEILFRTWSRNRAMAYAMALAERLNLTGLDWR